MTHKITSWHVGIAAEAFVAGLFARCGYDVSVQYGANQPEYDLIVVKGDKMLKVSVKGSQDGGWGLTQSYKKGVTYREATDRWLLRHHKGTVMCFVQFENVALDELPRVYLATPSEVAEVLNNSAGGRGDTILYEQHIWGERAAGRGTTDKIPEHWRFSTERIIELFDIAGV